MFCCMRVTRAWRVCSQTNITFTLPLCVQFDSQLDIDTQTKGISPASLNLPWWWEGVRVALKLGGGSEGFPRENKLRSLFLGLLGYNRSVSVLVTGWEAQWQTEGCQIVITFTICRFSASGGDNLFVTWSLNYCIIHAAVIQNCWEAHANTHKHTQAHTHARKHRHTRTHTHSCRVVWNSIGHGRLAIHQREG